MGGPGPAARGGSLPPTRPGRLDPGFLAAVDRRLAAADERLAGGYPGDPGTRQPVHTVYVPADQAGPDTARSWGDEALKLLDEIAPDAPSAAAVTGLGDALTGEVLGRVRAKLAGQPVEDLRLDFEDGYGPRPDAEPFPRLTRTRSRARTPRRRRAQRSSATSPFSPRPDQPSGTGASCCATARSPQWEPRLMLPRTPR